MYYTRVLSKACSWMAMRLFVLAEQLMRQSSEVGSDGREDANVSQAENGLPGSPPAHWLEMVRRQAPELYRSVVSRRAAAAGRAGIPASDDGSDVNGAVRSVADATAGMPQSTARPDMTPQPAAAERRERDAAQQEKRGTTPAESQKPASVEVPDARRAVRAPRPEQAVSLSISHRGTTDRILPPRRAQVRSDGDIAPSLPSRQVRVAEARQAREEGPHSTDRTRTSPKDTSPQRWHVRQPGTEESRTAPAPRRMPEIPDAGVAGTVHAAPEFQARRHPPADTPVPPSWSRGTVRMPGPSDSPASSDPGLPPRPLSSSPAVPAGADLRRFGVPASMDMQPLEAPRWASLPDPVEEAGTDARWAALPDDGWTQPLRVGTSGGPRQGDELYGSDGYLFEGRPGSSWSE